MTGREGPHRPKERSDMSPSLEPNGSTAIHVQGLTKRYGSLTAVSDLSIEVPPGVTAGFIGPNGAGKTTTLRMLLGLVRPTGGTGTVLGRPDRKSTRLNSS